MDSIDYSIIDEECVDLVKFFNEYGLRAEFSCQGHPEDPMSNYNIIFHDSVKDSDIEEFLSKFTNQYTHNPFLGRFSKWARKRSGVIVYNWQYSVTTKQDNTKNILALIAIH